MKINPLRTENDERSIEIRCNEVSFGALLRCMRRIPETVVTNTSFNPMTDDAHASIRYKDLELTLETPFSDYIIFGPSQDGAFDEFVAKLRDHKVRWWEKIF